MKNLIVSIITALFMTLCTFAQAPDILWTRTYGGPLSDRGKGVIQTSDGGYLILGESLSFSPDNEWCICLIKTNALGDSIWTRTYCSAGSIIAEYFQQTSDDGYIILGQVHGPINEWDAILIKTDSNGDTLWSRIYGGIGLEWGFSVQQTSDGGYIICGRSNSFSGSFANHDIYLIKTDANGDTLWTRLFGGPGLDYAYDILQSLDQGYTITGATHNLEPDVFVLKLNADGDSLWMRTYGGYDYDCGWDILQNSAGEYLIIGSTWSVEPGNGQVYFLKTDINGETILSRTYGGNDDDEGYCLQQTVNGGYVIVGRTSSFTGGTEDVYIIKINDQGDTLWTISVGGTYEDRGESIQQISDGGYIVAGTTHSFGAGQYDIFLIRLGSETRVPNIPPISVPEQYSLHPPYPNPFNPTTTLSFDLPNAGNVVLEIYNIQGQKVSTIMEGYRSPGYYDVTFDASELTSGIYFARLTAGAFQQSQKLLSIK